MIPVIDFKGAIDESKFSHPGDLYFELFWVSFVMFLVWFVVILESKRYLIRIESVVVFILFWEVVWVPVLVLYLNSGSIQSHSIVALYHWYSLLLYKGMFGTVDGFNLFRWGLFK